MISPWRPGSASPQASSTDRGSSARRRSARHNASDVRPTGRSGGSGAGWKQRMEATPANSGGPSPRTERETGRRRTTAHAPGVTAKPRTRVRFPSSPPHSERESVRFGRSSAERGPETFQVRPSAS
jgi:hypothetical protein